MSESRWHEQTMVASPWQRFTGLIAAFIADDGHRTPHAPSKLPAFARGPALIVGLSSGLKHGLMQGGMSLLGTVMVVLGLAAMALDLGFWLYAPEFDTAGRMNIGEQALLIGLGLVVATLMALQMSHRRLLEEREADMFASSRHLELQDELRGIRADLAQARARLADYEARNVLPPHVRDERLALIGHDLRTPLNAVIGFADLMAQEVYGPIGHPKYREYARHVRDSGRALLGVAQDILALEAQQREGEELERQLRKRPARPIATSPSPSEISRPTAPATAAAAGKGVAGEVVAGEVRVPLNSRAAMASPTANRLDVEQAIARSLAGLRQTAADLGAKATREHRFGRRTAA